MLDKWPTEERQGGQPTHFNIHQAVTSFSQLDQALNIRQLWEQNLTNDFHSFPAHGWPKFPDTFIQSNFYPNQLLTMAVSYTAAHLTGIKQKNRMSILLNSRTPEMLQGHEPASAGLQVDILEHPAAVI